MIMTRKFVVWKSLLFCKRAFKDNAALTKQMATDGAIKFSIMSES